MKILTIISLILCLASLAAIAVCIFTDWNDGLYLPLALALSAAGNAVNILSNRKDGHRKETER